MALHSPITSLSFLGTFLGSSETSTVNVWKNNCDVDDTFSPAVCSLFRPLEVRSVNSLCRSLINLPLVLLDRGRKSFSLTLSLLPFNPHLVQGRHFSWAPSSLILTKSGCAGQSQYTHTLSPRAQSSLSAAHFVLCFSWVGPITVQLGLLTQRECTKPLRGSEAPCSFLELKLNLSWGIGQNNFLWTDHFHKFFLHLCFFGLYHRLTFNVNLRPSNQLPVILLWHFANAVVGHALQLTQLSAIYFILVLQLKESDLTYCYKWFKF